VKGSTPPTSTTSTVWDDLERAKKEQYCLSLKEALVEKGHKFTGDLILVIRACGQCTMTKECFFVNRTSMQWEKCTRCVVQKKKCENVISEFPLK